MVFRDYRGCNCGPRQLGDGAADIIAASDAGAMTAQLAPTNTQQRSIWLGIGTGLAVWFITRFLDKYVFGDKT